MSREVTLEKIKKVMNGIGFIETEKLKDIHPTKVTDLIVYLNPANLQFYKKYLKSNNIDEIEKELAIQGYLSIGIISIKNHKNPNTVVYSYKLNKNIAATLSQINQRESITSEILGQDTTSTKIIKQTQLIESTKVFVPSFQILSQNNYLLIKKAYEFAKRAHYGQGRLDGTEYITHPERVSEYVEAYVKNDITTLKIASHLHDTVEDTDVTFRDIANNFGLRIAKIVFEVTNDDDMKHKLGKSKYLSQKMVKMSSLALTLKLCDRLDNVSDLGTSSPKFREKYIKETLEEMDYLLKMRILTPTQLHLVSLIVEKVSSVLEATDPRKENIKRLKLMLKYGQKIIV